MAYGRRHFYNHHRSHSALDWNTRAHTLNQLLQDNLPRRAQLAVSFRDGVPPGSSPRAVA